MLLEEDYSKCITEDIKLMRNLGYDDEDIIDNINILIKELQLTIGDLGGW